MSAPQQTGAAPMAIISGMSISSSTGLVWIGAALAAALLAGCDERTKQAGDPPRPAIPQVANQPMVPQVSSAAVAGEASKDPLKR